MDFKKLCLGLFSGLVAVSANAGNVPQCNSNETLIRRGHPYQYACAPKDSYALQVRCDSPNAQLNFVVPYISPGVPQNLVNGPEFKLMGSNATSTGAQSFHFSGVIQPSLEFANNNNFSISVAVYNDPQNRNFVLSFNNGVVSLEGVGQGISNYNIERTLYASIQR